MSGSRKPHLLYTVLASSSLLSGGFSSSSVDTQGVSLTRSHIPAAYYATQSSLNNSHGSSMDLQYNMSVYLAQILMIFVDMKSS